jgi:hypothetical protein
LPTVTFPQSGHTAKPNIRDMEFYEAAIGDLTQPAKSGRHRLLSKADSRFRRQASIAVIRDRRSSFPQ